MSILDRYGIKEVADVTFYEIGANGNPERPVLYLDTLKVSTIEQTGEMADARGGKGNPKLITWDYGKEITVTLEDALFSAKSMAIMFSDGKHRQLKDGRIMRTERFRLPRKADTADGETAVAVMKALGWSDEYIVGDKSGAKDNAKFYDENSNVLDTAAKIIALAAGDVVFCTFDLEVKEGSDSVIVISGTTFPGTYYVTGDTYARSDVSGKDEFFQFIIPKAKVTSENTISLEAEGDPSVFNMNLQVLRPESGDMMKLVKYDLDDNDESDDDLTVAIAHNHVLDPANTANSPSV